MKCRPPGTGIPSLSLNEWDIKTNLNLYTGSQLFRLQEMFKC